MSFCKNPAEDIIRAGKLLQEKGLVVRTWGNVSVRACASHFSITPTGARYETLQEADIVQVSLEKKLRNEKVSPLSYKLQTLKFT